MISIAVAWEKFMRTLFLFPCNTFLFYFERNIQGSVYFIYCTWMTIRDRHGGSKPHLSRTNKCTKSPRQQISHCWWRYLSDLQDTGWNQEEYQGHHHDGKSTDYGSKHQLKRWWLGNSDSDPSAAVCIWKAHVSFLISFVLAWLQTWFLILMHLDTE